MYVCELYLCVIATHFNLVVSLKNYCISEIRGYKFGKGNIVKINPHRNKSNWSPIQYSAPFSSQITSSTLSTIPMEDDEFTKSPLSFKQKLKNSLCFSCCFPHHHRNNTTTPTTKLYSLDYRPPPPPSSDENPSLIWIKNDFPDIKDKCRTIFNFIGNGNGNRHKRHSSAEFRYDPLSYALNFEDGYEDDEAPLRNFSSRLPPPPPSPPLPSVKALSLTAASVWVMVVVTGESFFFCLGSILALYFLFLFFLYFWKYIL